MAAYLQVSNVSKSFGKFQALKEATFSVNEGELVCILGPSGCGKTTLLRVIAGLEEQSAGEITQKGVTISNLPPDQRDFGIVFQSYALFPNLSIKNNITFGLKTRNQNSQIIESRLNELLSLIGLEAHKNKYPAQLSGGEQQRVALARALAPSPGLLLLDEPLSALDAKVRQHLRLEIKNLQKKLGVTTIMVTHDQEEALSMADRIILMNKGVIEQIGTPHELYSQPNTSFAADFIGKTNLISASKVSDTRINMLGSDFDCSDAVTANSVTVAIRPEDIKITANASDPNTVQGKVLEIEFLGSYSIGQVEVQHGDQSGGQEQRRQRQCHDDCENAYKGGLKRQRPLGLSHQKHHRSDGAGAGQKRNSDGKYRKIVAVLSFFFLAAGRASEAALMGEDHLDGEDQQQKAAGDPKGAEADSEQAQQEIAGQGKKEQGRAGNRHGPARCPALGPGRQITGEAGKYRQHRDRVDNHEQRDESGGGEFPYGHRELPAGIGRSGVSRDALGLNKNAGDIWQFGLYPFFQIGNRAFDLARAHVVVEIDAEIEQNVLRPEMHRQDFVDGDDAGRIVGDVTQFAHCRAACGFSDQQSLALDGQQDGGCR